MVLLNTTVRDVALLRNKLMGVMVFNLWRKYTSQSCAWYIEQTLLIRLFSLTSNTTNFLQYIHTYLSSYFRSTKRWVHLCLARGIDCLPYHVVGLCCPPPFLAWPGSWAWLALVSVNNNLSFPSVP
jgi:hypothetical protein